MATRTTPGGGALPAGLTTDLPATVASTIPIPTTIPIPATIPTTIPAASWGLLLTRTRRAVTEQPRVADLAALVLVAAALVVYAVDDRAWVHHVCYLGTLVLAALSACVAAATAPPAERGVPRLVALGLGLNALADVVWQVVSANGGSTDISWADPLWFASYGGLGAAMWVVLVRSLPGGRPDATFVIDALTVIAVSVLVFWHFSIDAIVRNDDVSPFVRGVWSAYPVADAVLLALVVRVLINSRARALLGSAFGLGVVLWLAADIAYLRLPSGVGEGWLDAGWMVGPVFLARAVWHWDPAPVTVAPAVSAGPMGSLSIAVAPLFVPPVLDALADLRGQDDRPGLLLGGSLVLITLAFLRTARLVRAEAAARRELEAARDEALAASHAKSMFVATVSHEIRTPLTTVLATAEFLEDTPLDEDQQQLLSRMRRSGVVLHSLVEEVLDFSRIESGHLRLEAVPFDLHALVEHLAEVYRPRAGAAGLTFDAHLAPGLPRHVVGDPARLQQVAGNLLDNALKFTDAGGLRLAVRPAGPATHAPLAGDPTHVEVVVTDTGIGIDPAGIERLLGAFEQADGSSTRRHGGVGLGLAICRELAERMGGSLTVRSEPGCGSEFTATVVVRVAD